MRLRDKVVIVTGSTTGIGKAIALRCIEEGARVVINGLEQKLGEAVVDRLGSRSVLHVEDLTVEGAPGRLVEKAVTVFGRLDGVVNNAAAVVSSNIETTDLPLLRKIMEINTVVPFAMIRAALPHLSETRGSVLNIGSINAWCGEPDLLAYSISKGALMTLTRNLGDTLHRESGVRVNQINPGWVLTEREVERKREQGLPENWYEGIPDRFAPAGRILLPKEVANAALFWLGDESGPVSGQVMTLEQHPVIGRNPPKDIETLTTRLNS